jgi:hypothetical protein
MPVRHHYEGPVPDGHDPDEYDRLRRRVLWSLPTGLFVVGSRSGERRNLMTANWVMQVAVTPKLVAVSVERGSVTASLVEEGGGFSVSVLSRSDRALVRRFVKPVEDIVTDEAGVALTMQGTSMRQRRGWPAGSATPVTGTPVEKSPGPATSCSWVRWWMPASGPMPVGTEAGPRCCGWRTPG